MKSVSVKNECPGCGASVVWEEEALVPSLPGFDEPPDTLVRYLTVTIDRIGRSRTVHKCKVPVEPGRDSAT